MLDVYTMNGSVVTAKMAGTESTAKTRSASSTIISAKNSGVAHHTSSVDEDALFGALMKNRLPWRSGVTRKNLRSRLMNGLLAMSGF